MQPNTSAETLTPSRFAANAQASSMLGVHDDQGLSSDLEAEHLMKRSSAMVKYSVDAAFDAISAYERGSHGANAVEEAEDSYLPSKPSKLTLLLLRAHLEDVLGHHNIGQNFCNLTPVSSSPQAAKEDRTRRLSSWSDSLELTLDIDAVEAQGRMLRYSTYDPAWYTLRSATSGAQSSDVQEDVYVSSPMWCTV
ncbi:hypothetical protein CYLTODRAFT_457283 [Cylindrobasidium torrendii FP15055 ss-10]|uniref:Uncharacterized protein n=1 Tax=Cylindrobasidium torrendii FP15055 ss-10 TaxID=1314674 RepID=A0A0D7B159_9AGAR|nr:hypothetical protein CYLTODRAFT_457283 [Cylindrobasidium torrendii FP15055 ss-10]